MAHPKSSEVTATAGRATFPASSVAGDVDGVAEIGAETPPVLRVLVIGASGLLGSHIVDALRKAEPTLEVLRASRSSGDHPVDVTDEASIRALFETVGMVDHVVCAFGSGQFGSFDTLTTTDVRMSMERKFMDQVSVVLIGKEYLKPAGGFTLTSGQLSTLPVPMLAGLSAANGALEAFTRAASVDMPGDRRINCVSPSLLTESADTFGPFFKGITPVPAAEVALAYVRVVFTRVTGQVLIVSGDKWA